LPWGLPPFFTTNSTDHLPVLLCRGMEKDMYIIPTDLGRLFRYIKNKMY
jgi:hypothetical protein